MKIFCFQWTLRSTNVPSVVLIEKGKNGLSKTLKVVPTYKYDSREKFRLAFYLMSRDRDPGVEYVGSAHFWILDFKRHCKRSL
jgi:hypothetical protein